MPRLWRWCVTPILFLPGMMCDARQFGPQAAYFSRERPVIVAPLTGFDSITDLAKEVLTHAPAHFVLCGLSMGGIVAMEIMRLAPQRVQRLALMDTNYLADTEKSQSIRDAQIERARDGELEAVMRDELKPRYLADGDNKQEVLDLCMEMAKGLGPKVFIEQSLALRNRADQSETLRRVGVPTLILCGEADGLCPVVRHQQMHELIGYSQLDVIPGAGHLPPLEQPDRTTESIRRWLHPT